MRRSGGRSRADLRARHLDVRRGRLQAQGDQVALPHPRVLASRWIKADRLHPLVPRETTRWRE